YRNTILLIFSLLFYAWGEPVYVILMILIIISVYLCGLLLNKCDINKDKKGKKQVLFLAITFVLIFLLFFKYGNFIIDNLNILFNSHFNNIDFALPIGISFFSFQAISYLIDLYRNKVKVQKNLFDLALYVTLFPQLIAGPIVRYDTVEKELTNRKETIEDVISGFKRFIIGLSKKVLIANQMALLADTIFNHPSLQGVGTSLAWIGAIAYTFQIYFDFSGYSDMAIGLGKIFGFNFLENFNFPYIAKSITDFWHRWHISLSSWFKDYVYIPLGGNRVKKNRWIFNIILVWFLTGLWHGASWNFILWGLYFGFLLLIEKLFISKLKIPNFLRWLCTFILIIISWVIFRTETLFDLGLYLQKMFTFSHTNYVNIVFQYPKLLSMFIYFIPAIICSFPILKKWYSNNKNKTSITILSNIALIILFIFCISFLTSSSYNPFIYFRF
ncbi:MAG: MBOAT family O-acyltransferase, partial [Bacilli bacterium]